MADIKNVPFDSTTVKCLCPGCPVQTNRSCVAGLKKNLQGALARTPLKREEIPGAEVQTISIDESMTGNAATGSALQDKIIHRVGCASEIKVDIRIVAATHQNLNEMVRNKQFRADLWFRSHVFPIMIPPLRDRAEDIPALVSPSLR